MNSDLAQLFSPLKIRQKCQEIFDLARAGKTHFSLHLEKMPEVAKTVLSVIKKNYPELKIPPHSRLNHFQAGGLDRVGWAKERIQELGPSEALTAWFDLTTISVLLDAGAGEEWSYHEPSLPGLLSGGQRFTRSEGLGVASFHLFFKGFFANSKDHPLRVEGHRLSQLTLEDLEKAMQSESKNPLKATAGRLELLHRLGALLLKDKKNFGKEARLGLLCQPFQGQKKIEAAAVLDHVLKTLGPIWPSRQSLEGVALGDAWNYPEKEKIALSQIVPFHKLSQWLSYSLIDVLERQGQKVSNLDALTGLPEYRNGGLFLDLGVIQWRDPEEQKLTHKVSSDVIIEWRALTVILLDQLAPLIRQELKKELTLCQILEGGTWHAGRMTAKERRKNGGPPLSIESDGTVF